MKNNINFGYNLEISPIHCILAADVAHIKNKHNAKMIVILLYIAKKGDFETCVYGENNKDSPTGKTDIHLT